MANTSISTAVIWAISSAAQSIIIVTFFTFRQKTVPSEIIGRVVGITRLIAYLSIPLAAIISGIVMKYTNSFSLVSSIGALIIIFVGFGYFNYFVRSQKNG